jgi:hypothetical protein
LHFYYYVKCARSNKSTIQYKIIQGDTQKELIWSFEQLVKKNILPTQLNTVNLYMCSYENENYLMVTMIQHFFVPFISSFCYRNFDLSAAAADLVGFYRSLWIVPIGSCDVGDDFRDAVRRVPDACPDANRDANRDRDAVVVVDIVVVVVDGEVRSGSGPSRRLRVVEGIRFSENVLNPE